MGKGAGDRTAPGRPRAKPLIGTGEHPRREILDAAARLFTSVGFATATTRQIAEAVGLRQASLFHHFRRKEDVLAALLDRTVAPSLQYAIELANKNTPADVALYLLVVNDLSNYCSGPGNLGSLQVQPEARRERFRDFWEKRERLKSHYRDVICRGQQTAVFFVSDIDLTTNMVFAFVESTASWYEQSGVWPPNSAFDAVAQFILRALTDNGTAATQARGAAVLRHRGRVVTKPADDDSGSFLRR